MVFGKQNEEESVELHELDWTSLRSACTALSSKLLKPCKLINIKYDQMVLTTQLFWNNDKADRIMEVDFLKYLRFCMFAYVYTFFFN